ncbi:MAG: hypothetical protein QNL80_12115 [Akkermansiaceae bacterium]
MADSIIDVSVNTEKSRFRFTKLAVSGYCHQPDPATLVIAHHITAMLPLNLVYIDHALSRRRTNP